MADKYNGEVFEKDIKNLPLKNFTEAHLDKEVAVKEKPQNAEEEEKGIESDKTQIENVEIKKEETRKELGKLASGGANLAVLEDRARKELLNGAKNPKDYYRRKTIFGNFNEFFSRFFTRKKRNN